MIEKKLLKITNIALFIVFPCSLITGIIKFPGLLRFFGIDYTSLPRRQINLIHDWAGIILVVFIIVHIILNRGWVKNVLLSQFSGIKKIKPWHLIIIFLIIGTIFLIFYINNQINPENKIKNLESVEIKEYQGENLSSINNIENTGIKGIQNIDINNYSLEISGLVEKTRNYTYNEILEFPKYSKVVELNCVVGWSAKILWEGVLLKDLLQETGVKPEAKTAIFYAADGFTTSLPLDFIIDNNIILSYKMNGVVLPAEKGFPFQLVAEQKWGYKWIKWLTKIELSDNIDYRGTYESSGYNNDADITGPKRENN